MRYICIAFDYHKNKIENEQAEQPYNTSMQFFIS